MAFVALEPVVLTPTEMPVVADEFVTEIPVVAEADVAFVAVLLTPICVWLMPPDEVEPGKLCVWPGSVTLAVWVWPGSVTLAVWVWLTTIALAEPPVAPTA